MVSEISQTQERHDKICKLFDHAKTWEDRYRTLIELGKRLPPFPDSLKRPELLVKGCQSQVWLHTTLEASGKITLQGDSDALIVKGLVALLVQFYSGLSPEEILHLNPQFIETLGLKGALSPSRANGLYSMLKRIKYEALAHHHSSNSNRV